MTTALDPVRHAAVEAAQPLPWRRLVALALVGTVLAVARVVPTNVHTPRGIVNLIKPGAHSSIVPTLEHDFPGMALLPDVGHDGQAYYVLARQPMHLREVGPELDRPRYRAQRILFPLLVWALHPSGGGHGLVLTMLFVGIAALFAGGVVLGALSVTLRGSPWVAFVFPLLPGAIFSLNLSVPDALALVFALAAITLDLRGRRRSAVAAGTGAALTKEPVLLVLLGYALWRRDREGVRLLLVPSAAAALWWAALRIVFPSSPPQVQEFDPLHGLWVSAHLWMGGTEGLALIVSLLALVGALLALVRGALRGPLGWAIVVQLAFVPLLNANVLALAENNTRTLLPLLALVLVAIVTPRGAGRAAVASTRRHR